MIRKIRVNELENYIDKEIVFILVPCGDFTWSDERTVKVMSLFSDAESSVMAEFIDKFLLTFQILLCLMQL